MIRLRFWLPFHYLMSQYFARGRRCDLRVEYGWTNYRTGEVSWLAAHDPRCPCDVQIGLMAIPVTETPGYRP